MVKKRTVTLGIDPGLKGSLVAVDSCTGEFVECHNMPTTHKPYGMGKGQILSTLGLARIIKNLDPDFVALEVVASRPGQGVTSMFNFGCNFYGIVGVIAALDIKYKLVTPKQWQSIYARKSVWSKAESIRLAKLALPGLPVEGPRGGALDGVSDAGLIALWGFKEGRK
jgi:crossover junction endodeoxyribonuclease RuvC